MDCKCRWHICMLYIYWSYNSTLVNAGYYVGRIISNYKPLVLFKWIPMSQLQFSQHTHKEIELTINAYSINLRKSKNSHTRIHCTPLYVHDKLQ